MKKIHYVQNILSMIAGAASALAFQPVDWHWLAVLTPAILLHNILYRAPKAAFRNGFYFGLSFFTCGIYWVYICININTGAPAFVTFLMSAVLISYCAFYYGLLTWLTCKLATTPIGRLKLFPFAWVVSEYFRSNFFTGFPWLVLGYSQTDSILSSWYPLIGILGTSFILTVIASLLCAIPYFFKTQRAELTYSLMGITFILLISAILQKIEWTHANQKSLNVTIIQANINQQEKWSRAHWQGLLSRYLSQTREHLDSDLIVWPETAIPLLLEESIDALKPLEKQLIQTNTQLIFGVPVSTRHHKNYYNALHVLGSLQPDYDKKHLVIFGETTPFAHLLKPLLDVLNVPMSDYSAGTKPVTFTIQDVQIAPQICFDIVYSDVLKQTVKNSDMLLLASDDSWFGNSWALSQHLQIARARAIQMGRWEIIATNDGISSIVDQKGRIIGELPKKQIGTLSARVPGYEGNTPWVRIFG